MNTIAIFTRLPDRTILVETVGTDDLIIEWVFFACSEVLSLTDADNESQGIGQSDIEMNHIGVDQI